ncbi:hypothetical protein G7Y31_04025 [Corynebacterium lizhenjunii]|uniref:Uncharacterized protein n=1 Tax=Corynebacterium lizhenjunii TaxID=2709394 RepID=A0A7T0KGA8_9CORY|nr:hypothetical protein [Corynebacterium lizhenjunii]QPK79871.1 hypothetical protein G7Y31_04025 [Corynebacterium lizhenjunii]
MNTTGRTISAIAGLVVAALCAASPQPLWPLAAAIAILASYNLYTAQIRDKE